MTAATRSRLSPGIIGRLRLAAQGLLGPGFSSVPDAVRGMTAMQAQDLPSVLWALGQRVPGSGAQDIRGALDRGEIVRSWPMRGTLHVLAPEDLGWVLGITSGRMVQSAAGRHRQLGIMAADVELCAEIALGLVAGGGAASREALFAAFEAAGQGTRSQRGIHLLWRLCQGRWLVPGPVAGQQQLFAAFDDWITGSRSLDREEGTAEWLLRYFRSHGPATERDFSWWSGIPLTETRAALARVSDRLTELKFGGTSYWLAPETAALLDHGVPGQRTVLALPGFDEFLLGYADRSLVLPPEHAEKIVPGGNGVFRKTIVAGGAVIGTWAAPAGGRRAGVVPEPFDAVNGLRPAAQKSFGLQAAKYRRYLGS
ncbi:winged helix DNA-binding domain-containing protein [Arthrobacter sp. PM3]|uniref:winged helix DNA-binding domain-containing protein n=1 Tax=Arthrobacter sp. PM3 TaxID=2017685 RepID=UPI000E1098F5|nr:winged helix DNA-binding domain-containing protein [Arthrobacter sp. PM3]AXJ08336.1 hypothetical protein CFN17_00800 [Arthrobacter sp. PM3]